MDLIFAGQNYWAIKPIALYVRPVSSTLTDSMITYQVEPGVTRVEPSLDSDSDSTTVNRILIVGYLMGIWKVIKFLKRMSGVNLAGN